MTLFRKDKSLRNKVVERGEAAFAARAAAFAAAAVLCAASARAEDLHQSIVVGGVTRTYVLHVPANLTGKVPLILSFHGHGGDGAGQAKLTGLDRLADARGFIVVYPDGLHRAWNDGRPQEGTTADDLGFAAALQDDLERRFPIDRSRVYATGFSNGAVFTNYLACRQADRIAAIAPVSGTLPQNDVASCKPARTVSALIVSGTDDPVMPYRGGTVRVLAEDRGEVISVAADAALWARNDGCSSPPPSPMPLPSIAPADGTSVSRTVYRGCRDRSSVVLYTVVGGGHAWPDGPQYLPAAFIGTASAQIDASAAIVDFFLTTART
jgi:polyhydroxybutyrate depolymerase